MYGSISSEPEECMERLEYEKDGKSAVTWDYFWESVLILLEMALDLLGGFGFT